MTDLNRQFLAVEGPSSTRRSSRFAPSGMLVAIVSAFVSACKTDGSVKVAIAPPTATVEFDKNQAFTATVTGIANTAVTWKVMESGGGSITADGLYKAPRTAGTYHVVAASVADPSQSGSASVVVTAEVCDSLPTTPTWEKITPPGDVGDSAAVQVDPLRPGTVYVHMHKGDNGQHFPTDGLYVSNDCGSTWSRVPKGRNASDPGLNIHSGSFTSIIIDPTDSETMYTVSNYGPGGVWKSTNSGVDWDQLVPDAVGRYVNGLWFNALSIDPTNREHLAAANHAGCSGPYAPNCITETRDGGATWNLIAAPTEWAESNGVYIVDDSTMIFCTGQWGAYVTKDKGVNWTRMGQGCSGAGTGLPIYQAADATYYLSSDWGVISSKDLITWTMVFPGQFRQLAGSGLNMFTTNYWSFNYYIAAESQPTVWKPLGASSSPPGVNGGVFMAYERKHHVLYSSNYYDVYRIVTE